MRGATAKKIRRAARKLSKGKTYKKTYKHLKRLYKKTGDIDIIGNAERKAKLERSSHGPTKENSPSSTTADIGATG